MTLPATLSEETSRLYSEYATVPLWYGGIALYFEYFNHLRIADMVKLDLPAKVHRDIINIDSIHEADDAETYLAALRGMHVQFREGNIVAFSLFYMLNYALLYIQLYDAKETVLYNKLYALCLACFNYDQFRERDI